MNKLLLGAFAATGLTMLWGCSDTFDPSSDREGRILPSVDVSSTVAAPAKAEKSRAAGQAKAISADDLKLRLTAESGAFAQEWAGISSFDNTADFPVGMYLFEALYGSPADEGFDKPYYYGSTSVRVLENQTTPVNVTATLGNAMISIVYTDAVKNYFTSFSDKIVTRSGAELSYGLDETRPLYITPGHVDVVTTVTKPNGVSGTVTPVSFEAEARHHYLIEIDVNDGEVGNAVFTVTFNSDLVEEEVELELSDKLLTAPAPEVNATGFTAGETLNFVEGTTPASPLRMTVMAVANVQTAVLTVNSASLREQGWPETVDFASADASTLATLKRLGLQFPGLEGVKSQMAVVDFTNVVKNIACVDGADNTSTFTLVAKDANSKTSEPVSFSVAIEKVNLEITSVDPLTADDTELTMTVDYNGGDLASNVKFETKNLRGTWDNAQVLNVAPVSRGGESYRVTISVPASSDDVIVRGVSGNLITPERTVVRGGASIALDNNDVYATSAAISVLGAHGVEFAGEAKLLLSTNGTDFTEHTAKTAEGNVISFTGLTGATKYYVKVDVNNGQSKAIEFTTEAAAQLPDAGFDSWSSEKKGDYQYLWSVAGSGAWNTLNALTTSQNGSGSGNGLNTGGCSYKATSGTIPANGRSTQSTAGGGAIGTQKHSDGHTEGNSTLHSDKQHSGANAALVRTVGWGSGNTAKASGSGFGTCNNTTVGELYLGTVDGTNPVYGYAFSSRPKSVSFYYHYDVVSGGNGDFGTADVKVSDAAGNVIAEGSVTLPEQGAYAPITIPLNYTGNAKAASISVVFKSSGNSDALNKSTTFWHCPGAKNVSGGEYVGSELYVDDVVLNY